jgi:TRAP-type mannitol/chloroaromatic compound transport system permease large subunit
MARRLACFVMFILIGSRVFSLTFYGVNVHIWVEELMSGIPGGVWGFLIAVNALVFVLGCFIDFFEIAFIIIPLLAPVAQKLGIDLVWFGIIIGMNMQTSFLTPPFGFALFYMRSVAPNGPWVDKPSGRTIAGVTTAQIYRGGIASLFTAHHGGNRGGLRGSRSRGSEGGSDKIGINLPSLVDSKRRGHCIAAASCLTTAFSCAAGPS